MHVGRNSSHFPGIECSKVLERVHFSKTERMHHAEHLSLLTGLARGKIYVHMGNFHPTSLRSHLAQDGTSPNRADSFPM